LFRAEVYTEAGRPYKPARSEPPYEAKAGPVFCLRRRSQLAKRKNKCKIVGLCGEEKFFNMKLSGYD
jgi:hypothetical protein